MVDGANQAKPAMTAMGFALWGYPNVELIAYGMKSAQGGTNNTAEYGALEFGLRFVNLVGLGSRTTVFSDSRLVVNQVNGSHQTRDLTLQKYRKQVRDLMKVGGIKQVVHVARAFNADADRLSKAAKSLPLDTEWVLEQSSHRFVAMKEELEDLHRVGTLVKDNEGRTSDTLAMAVTRSMRRQGHDEGSTTGTDNGPAHDDVTPRNDGEVVPQGQEGIDLVGLRRSRIADAQRKVPWMKAICDRLSGLEPSFVSRRDRRMAQKGTKEFKLGEDRLLMRKPTRVTRAFKPSEWQIVVPPELREDILHACHDEIFAGHLKENTTYARCASHFYWPGIARDVRNYCAACRDCQTGKGHPQNRARMGRNSDVIQPMEQLSMDILQIKQEDIQYNVIVYQCQGTSYHMFDVIEESSAELCAESYLRTVLGRYGASKEVRIDRDSRWLGHFYQALWRLMRQRQRATMSFRPQGDAKNERSHSTWCGIVRMYCENSDMSDWKQQMRYLEFAINTVWHGDKKETPFYLFHGWDPRMPLEAMVGRSSDKLETVDSKSSRAWRRAMQRRVQLAREYAREAMYERWDKQIKAYEGKERGKPFKEGDRVWIYVEKPPTRIPKKLAHKWHGPFRVKAVHHGGQYYELFIHPDYRRVHPYVHFNRLKLCIDAYTRPTLSLDEASLEEFDFDEELLPEDSWLNEDVDDEEVFEVEYIIDRKDGPRTRSGRRRYLYLIKWKRYSHDFNTWEPEEMLNCGALLYDFNREMDQRQRSIILAGDSASEDRRGICDAQDTVNRLNASGCSANVVSADLTSQSSSQQRWERSFAGHAVGEDQRLWR